MLYNLFNSRFGRCMTRLGDLLLQVVFLLTSLPVFTAGAGIAALYTVSKQLCTDAPPPGDPGLFCRLPDQFQKSDAPLAGRAGVRRAAVLRSSLL